MHPLRYLPPILFHYLFLNFTPIIYVQHYLLFPKFRYCPFYFKQVIITPILKKPSLDPESLLNYRLISQLPLVSKILERVVSHQLISYLTANNLLIPQKCGFRRGHSTETDY